MEILQPSCGDAFLRTKEKCVLFWRNSGRVGGISGCVRVRSEHGMDKWQATKLVYVRMIDRKNEVVHTQLQIRNYKCHQKSQVGYYTNVHETEYPCNKKSATILGGYRGNRYPTWTAVGLQCEATGITKTLPHGYETAIHWLSTHLNQLKFLQSQMMVPILTIWVTD